MTKEQFKKFLESATEAQLDAIAAVIEGKDVPAVKAAQDAQAKAEADLKAANEAVAAKVKEAVDAHNAGHEAAIEAAKASVLEQPEVKAAMALANEHKASTIKVLMETKRCDKTEEQLKALSQTELDSMVKLAGAKPVDYSGQAPRGVDQADTVPAAPDTVAAVKALAAARK